MKLKRGLNLKWVDGGRGPSSEGNSSPWEIVGGAPCARDFFVNNVHARKITPNGRKLPRPLRIRVARGRVTKTKFAACKKVIAPPRDPFYGGPIGLICKSLLRA